MLHTTVFLGVKVSCFQKKKGRPSTRKDFGECGSDSNESETVELRLAFEIEKSVLHHIHADRICQQTAATRHAANKSVVEMVIIFWRSRASLRKLLGHINYGGHLTITTDQPW